MNKSFAFLYDHPNEVPEGVSLGLQIYSTEVRNRSAEYSKKMFGLESHLEKLKDYGVI